jgi:predicted sulfurtransferase
MSSFLLYFQCIIRSIEREEQQQQAHNIEHREREHKPPSTATTMLFNRNSDDTSATDQAVVLFYHYFAESSEEPPRYPDWWKDPKESVKTLYENQEHLCKDELHLTGRILIAEEGINGTVAGKKRDIEAYIKRMKEYHFGRYFRSVDWKVSTVNTFSTNEQDQNSPTFLFPDLKICIVKEIVSTGGLVDVHDIPKETGKHLSPEEFHCILEAHATKDAKPQIVLIDVRNTFEHNIGHFVHPETGEKAMDPQMTTFASFDKFCDQHKDELKDKQVLMYCTGGIRCEKASILLKRKGVENVSQLSGGIQRYLEKYGNDGYFKGLNFTFDKRVAMKPDGSAQCTNCDPDRNTNDVQDKKKDEKDYEVVGHCVECSSPFVSERYCHRQICDAT